MHLHLTSENKSTINAKCPNLKHKTKLAYVQNTSAKTRFKTKSNDQKRTQSSTHYTFKHSTKCTQKDQHQINKL